MSKASNFKNLEKNAQIAFRRGQYDEAANTYTQAVEAYTRQGDQLMAAEMKNNQCVALLRAKKPATALKVIIGTEKVFAQANDCKRLGMMLANKATILDALHRSKEAIACYHQAADMLEKADEGDLRAVVMQYLTLLYFRRGKFIEAILALQSGLVGAKNLTIKQRIMKKILFLRLWQ